MKKRILSTLLAVVMMAVLLSTAALAETVPTVLVGGVEMYSVENVTYYKNGDTTTPTGTADDWNAKYEPGINTLTIKNLLLKGPDDDYFGAAIYANCALVIVLEGANSITGGDYTTSRGIWVDADLTINGSGALSVTGGDGDQSSAIFAQGSITINGGTINATGGAVNNSGNAVSCAIRSHSGDIVIMDGTVVATGGSILNATNVAAGSRSHGIYVTDANHSFTCRGGVVVARGGIAETNNSICVTTNVVQLPYCQVAGGGTENSSVVIVPSRWADGSGLGFSTGSVTLDKDYFIVNANAKALELSGDTTIDTNGRTLLVVSLYNDPSNNSYGIYAGVDTALNVTGSGSVIAVSGSGDNNYGICAKTTVSDASVTAIGTESAKYCHGIYGSVTAGGSAKVTAIGGRATGSQYYSYGIYGSVTVNDTASVTAIAGKAKGNSYGIANFVNGGVTVNSGTLCAVGGTAANLSYGIYVDTSAVNVAAGTAVSAVGEDYGLSLKSESCELAAGSFTGGQAAIYYGIYNSRVTDLLADGYCYYEKGVVQQPTGNDVGEAYQTITVQKSPPCTVSFHAGQGTLHGNTVSITVQPGETYGELPTASTTEEDMGFGGWWTGDGTNGNWGTQVMRTSIVTAVSDHTLYARYGHAHPVCGKTCTHNGEHENTLWFAIGTAEELLAIDSDGHYYLTADLTLENTWVLSNNVALDLNGHTLTGPVYVRGDRSFSLTDCIGTGKLIDYIEDAAVLDCVATSTFHQYGGTIQNTAENGHGIQGHDYHYYGGTVIADQYAINDVYTIHLYQTPDIRGGTADFYAENYLPTFTIQAEMELPDEAYTVDFEDRTGTFTFGWNAYMSGVECTRFFTSVNAGTFVEKDIDGELQLTALAFTQQPTEGNDYTAAVNDPDPTWQWYELGTKVFTVDDSSDGEIGIQILSGITYESEKGKLTSETGYLKFFYLAKDDIVTVTFNEEHSGRLVCDYINFGAKECNTWTGTVTKKGNVKIDFTGFTGGETFTITVTRKVPLNLLTGRTGASLLDKDENAAAIMDGKEYVCVTNGVVESEPVEFVHVHGGWTYSYAADGDGYGIITAKCSNEGCPLDGGSGTAECHVIIDTNAKYSSNPACPVDVDTPTTESDWYNAGLACPMVKSYGLTEGLEGSATITVDGEEVCTVPFTLQKGVLTAEEFTFANPDGLLIYNGFDKVATVAAKEPATVGTITVKYYKDGTEVNETKNVGTYTVKIDVTGSDYYNAVNDLEVGSFTIDPKDIAGDDMHVFARDTYHTGSPVTPKVEVYCGDRELTLDQDYRIISCENNTEVGTDTASVTITGTGNYTGTKTVKFSITYEPKDADEVLDWELADTGWFNATCRPVFTPKTGYEVSTEPNRDYSTWIEMGTTQVDVLYVRETTTGKIYQVAISYQSDLKDPNIVDVSGNPTEWTKDDVTLTVTATDVGAAGLAEQAYSFDGGTTWQAENTKTYNENTADIIIKVRDAAGNISGPETLSITKIDKTAPDRITVGADPHTTGDWYTAKPTIIVGAREEESGLAAEPYSFDGGATWQNESTKEYGDGIHAVNIWARDNVGNIAKCQPLTLKIDTTAPGDISVSAKVGEDDYTSGSDNRGDVVITLAGGEDTLSGFDKFQYKIGEDSWQDIPGSTFTHTASTGENGVTYKIRAVDKAGNASGELEFTVKKAFPVRFNANGGEGEMGNDTVYVNGTIVVPDCGFTREGYTFAGWNTAADGSGTEYFVANEIRDIREAPGGGFDLYAQWTVNEYKVTWLNYGGDGWEKDFDYGETINLPTIPDFAIMMHKLGYTQTGWLCSDNTVEVGDTMPAKDLTFTAQYTPNTYTVKFDANGGTGEMANQSFTYDTAAQALTANVFTRNGYKFVGWAESADSTGVDYVDEQSVSNLTAEANGEITLYAVWTRDIILSGNIVAPNVSDTENLDVVLVGLDGTEYPVSVTGSQSPYHYTVTVPEGEYQLIIKDTQNNVTVTAKEELAEDKVEEPITMPTGNKSSIVDSENAGEYAPIVGGLDAIAESTEGTNVTVTLTMTHEPANEDDAEHDALMDAAGSQKNKLTFFEIDLVKNVDGTETPITETTDPIEIVIPFDTTRKQNFKVYRFHDDNGDGDVDEGEVDILTTTANGDGEYIEVGTGSVTMHAKFFSLYAIGYNDVIPYYPVTHSCTSKCDVCGGCEDAACTENACKDKCRLFGMNFTDVAGGKWYTNAVEYVYHHKMMEGVGNNLFDINGTTTRAMIVTILWRLEGEPVVNYLMQFDDVAAETWYTEAVRWAASEGIVTGYSDVAFGPNDPITREQFVTILWRYAKYKGYDVSVGENTNILSYEDAFSVSEYAIPAMQWACGAGLMQGDGVNLTPKADATRAQAAALFQRFCENVAKT